MLNRKTAGVGLAAFGTLTASFLALATSGLLKTEDLRTQAYRDMVGVPTVCVGETRGVKMGDSYTREQCIAMLQKRIAEFDTALGRCIKVELPEVTRVAILKWAYNVGLGGACGSTVVRQLNTGQTEAACHGLMAWNKGTFSAPEAARQVARGEQCTVKKDGKYLCTIRGLTNARVEQRDSCLKGIGK